MSMDGRIRRAMDDLWTVSSAPSSWQQKMIAIICKLSAPADITEEELKKGMQSFKFKFRASTPDNDFVYYLTQSPFDKKWYTFQALYGESDAPTYIDDEYPAWFDAD